MSQAKRPSSKMISGLAALVIAGAVFPSAAAAVNCAEWSVSSPGRRLHISQANGYNLYFDFDQRSRGWLYGPARAISSSGKTVLHGHANGHVTGNTIKFDVHWSTGGGSSQYSGNIFEGIGGRGARGVTGTSLPLPPTTAWTLVSPLLCLREGP